MRANLYLQFGKYTKDYPKSLLIKIKKIKKGKSEKQYIVKVLKAIREEFDPRNYKVTYTNDFKKSRFISAANVLKKRQRSCGSLATIVASILRNLGYPTKLIDGFYIKDNSKMRHAWNEVFINKKWLQFDISRKNLRIGKYHIRKKEWIDWGDLEKIY